MLLHPTSLPSDHGIGDFGHGARRFVDWLVEARISVWQLLPLVPPGPGSSPYATTGAFALSPWLIDLGGLVADGWLPGDALSSAPSFDPDRLDMAAVEAFKGPLLARAAAAVASAQPDALADYCAAEPWVVDFARYQARKAEAGGAPWWEWPERMASREPEHLDAFDDRHRSDIQQHIALQWLAETQWASLRAYCAAAGVQVLGDVPIYVDHDSADVWAHQRFFELDAAGRASRVSGVPPDFFSELGQRWGHPLFRWDVLAADDYAWWVARMRRACALTDSVRLDHFRGFAAYWAIPGDAPDARAGGWEDGPGAALFDRLKEALGDLPLIAEDLGEIDDAVHDLRDGAGIPGMKILQFAFGGESDHPFLPHNYTANTVVYTGTHDNNTTLGWWRMVDEPVRDHVRRYLAVPGHDIAWDMIRAAFQTVSQLAVVPLQDILAFDSGARMNVPGTVDGNWAWRVRVQAFHSSLAARLRTLAELYGRAAPTR